jgi:hypothetical protein
MFNPNQKAWPLLGKKMTSTIDTLLWDLRHKKSFIDPPIETSEPYVQSMQGFQTFTHSIIHALEAAEPATIALAESNTLQDLYTDLPSFHIHQAQVGSNPFRDWVKTGTLKHPQRRTAKQHQYLHIVELQSQQNPHMSLVDIISSATAAVEEWRERAYDAVNIVQDPAALHFFTYHSKNGLETLSLDEDDNDNDTDSIHTTTKVFKKTTVHPTDECPVCINPFDSTTHIPKKAPCAHVFCFPCITSWLYSSTGTYACSLCRACLICGRNPCTHHDLPPPESVLPMPLPEILDAVLADRLGKVLHGFLPETYWVLRERTRKDRVVLASTRGYLGAIEDGDPVGDLLERAEREAAERIRGEILEALGQTEDGRTE